jgi:seryl-tRNA synthetase
MGQDNNQNINMIEIHERLASLETESKATRDIQKEIKHSIDKLADKIDKKMTDTDCKVEVLRKDMNKEVSDLKVNVSKLSITIRNLKVFMFLIASMAAPSVTAAIGKLI